jgi:BioD-like phosphotransacetylase family protein
MSAKIGLYRMVGGERGDEAVERLAEVLDGAEVTEPDEVGVFEVELETDDQEEALTEVFDAIAAAGVDDQIVLLEHPDLPEHWRSRASGPGS